MLLACLLVLPVFILEQLFASRTKILFILKNLFYHKIFNFFITFLYLLIDLLVPFYFVICPHVAANFATTWILKRASLHIVSPWS
jgi:hypothetical protein